MQEIAKTPMRNRAMMLARGLLSATALIMMSMTASAESAVDRSVSLSSQQWQKVDQMTNAATLASLGINIVQVVEAIEEQQTAFPQTLRALRYGDEDLGLEPAASPEVLDQIDRVEVLWLRYDAAMTAIIDDLRRKPEVDVAYFEALFDVHVEITGAIDEMTEAFRRSRHHFGAA